MYRLARTGRERLPPSFHQPEDTIARHILLTGRVQGVFFRKELRNEANRWHVKGWVRNLPSGQVEALLVGQPEAVAEVLAWCNSGPELARVDHVAVSDVATTEVFTRFIIIPGETR